MLKSVSVLVLDGLAVFEFGVICEVFGIDRSADGVPNFDFKVCGPEAGEPLRMSVGASLTPDHDLSALAGADLVAVPAIAGLGLPAGGARRAARGRRRGIDHPDRVLGRVRRRRGRAARRARVYDALDARRRTRRGMYPTAKVDRNVLFVDDGNLITSAGTAAGIDACLHLVRRELGSAVTNVIARRMVVPPQRDGGQRQYIEQPIPVRCSEGFAPQLDWILANLDEPHTVGTLAAPGQHVGPHLRPPVRRGDRHHADAVGDRSAGAVRAAAARGDRSGDRPDRRSCGLRDRDTAAPPLPAHHRCHPVGLPAQLRVRIRLRGNSFRARSPSPSAV